MVKTLQRHRTSAGGILAGLACAAVMVCGAGCQPSTRLTLVQPKVTGRQRQLDLATEQGWFAIDGRTERLLVQLPLPGATSGRPTFLLYLRVTPAMTGASGRAAREPRRVTGFFIQTHGEMAGKINVTAAQVTPRSVSRSSHRAEIDVTFNDGSTVRGKVLARRSDRTLHDFETQRYAGDVENVK